MMPVKLNRHVNLLVMLMTLAAAGCSQNSKDALSLSDLSPESNNAYVDRYFQNYQPIDKSEINKTAQSYKDTVWERLLSLYALPKIENERIDREIDWYLNHPQALNTLQQRAEPYLHLILDEVESKKIPGELALLPVVESSFVPNASSRVDASGLWQFMPATGRMFGLQQNSWYDGRRDVYASTKAATTYLKQLSETFDGDWLLALASYNWGKGNVRKSIERNEGRNMPTDYWSLHMPDETANYVPKLLAIAKIFAHADEYNVNLHHIPNKPYFEVVNLDSQLSLNKAAEMANMTLNDFLKLNPAFNKSKTAPEGAGPRRLLIPVAKAETFKENLAQLPFSEWISEGFEENVEDESTAIYFDEPKLVHKVKESVVAKVSKPQQSVKALLAGKKLDKLDNKNDKKSVALAHKESEKSKAKVPNHIAELSQKISANNKALAEKNKSSANSKSQKNVAKPVTVAVATKTNVANKKSTNKHG